MRLCTCLMLFGFAFTATAQDVVVYDDALQNGFVDGYSYGGGTDLLHTTTTHNASPFAIAFTGNDPNAVAFPHETVDFNSSQYVGVRFYVHGGINGGQQLRIQLYNNLGGVPVANVELDSFISGGAIAANEWRLVDVRFANAPLAFSGTFDRLDLQSDAPGMQPTLYIDDVALIAAPPPTPNIFSDGFEGSGVIVAPTFSINDVSSNEGDAGATAFTFTITRGGGLAATDSVQVQSVDDSATAPSDYTALAQTTLTFAPNVTTQTATVDVNGDTTFESDERFFANLSNPSSGTISDSQGIGTITNDDAAATPGQLRFSVANYNVGEADGLVTITVQRVGGSDGLASVDYATSNVTAIAPGDYSNSNGTLFWGNGDALAKTFDVPIVDDGLPETNETVALTLSNAVGAALDVPSMAVLTIVEPELMFVPQYTTSAIKIYRRGSAGFALLRTAPLGAAVLPNSLAFGPDGKLWVVDNGVTKRLLGYTQTNLLNAANPAPTVTIGPVGGNNGDIFDMAFFGDFAYVTQSNFGAIDRVLKYTLANLAASGNPAATNLTAASLDVPAGLEFDAVGRLWISNYNNNTLVRMNSATGAIDKIGSTAAMPGARNSLNLPEGLAFDADDSLWVGNNGEPTISGYAQWQLDAAGFGATVPVHQINVNPALFQSDTVGGLAFDRDGDLWANYQKTLSVLEYGLTPLPRAGGLPGVGSYVSAAGQILGTATTLPGFGGIAIWPIPASTHTSSATFRGTNVVGMEMNYAWFSQAIGPIGGTDYPVHDTRLIDYFSSKGMTAIRFLFSWEAMQSTLMGPVPASNVGNYRDYFDRYKNIVDYATNVKGMQVIVEPWQADAAGGAGGPRWRGGLVGSVAVPTAAWSDFWTKFAGVYAGNARVSFGLINEPNAMSTMGWWAIAQAGVTAIRNAGATQRIFVPGNGYTAASTWVIGDAFYDTDPVRRSNAYGYLNANGPGNPIADPLNNMAVEVHTYLDTNEGGSTTEITSITAARQHLEVVVAEARLRGYKVYLGELGFLATVPIAPAAWADFIAYFEANQDVLVGFSWFAGGAPAWWDDIGASGGGHFAITPTDDATFTGDTVNMNMIENDF
ncbi:MAG: cellulase family glycosylhydrolase [Pseudomonadota bacterium]|nr:cellulase family glycosylhydrolase [Pseudomonadota bacterium]